MQPNKLAEMLNMSISHNVYQMIWEIKNEVYRPQEEIKLLTMTWNMARKVQTPEFADLLPNV